MPIGYLSEKKINLDDITNSDFIKMKRFSLVGSKKNQLASITCTPLYMFVHTYVHTHTYLLVPAHATQTHTYTHLYRECVIVDTSSSWSYPSPMMTFFPFNNHEIIANYKDSIEDLPQLVESERA